MQCCHRANADTIAAIDEDKYTCNNADSKHDPQNDHQWSASIGKYNQEAAYVRRLEHELHSLQKSFLTLTTSYSRMQFRLRQIIQASPFERDMLLKELEKVAFQSTNDEDMDELTRMKNDMRLMGDVRRKQTDIISKLRNQLTELSEAAYTDKGHVASGSRKSTKISLHTETANESRIPHRTQQNKTKWRKSSY